MFLTGAVDISAELARAPEDGVRRESSVPKGVDSLPMYIGLKTVFCKGERKAFSHVSVNFSVHVFRLQVG